LDKSRYDSKGWKHVFLIVLPYIVVDGTFQYAGLWLAEAGSASETMTDKQFFIVALFDLVASISLVYYFTVVIVGKRWVSVGLKTGFVLRDIMTGVMTGFAMMAVAFFVLVYTRQVEIMGTDPDFRNSLWTLGTFLLVGVFEEVLLRGYVLNNLLVSFNKLTALLISSGIFAVLHLGNPGIDMTGFLGLFFAGLLLGCCYLFTGNLWLPVALHFSWNFFQSFFGFNVSGQDFYSFFITGFSRENIWNGGHFGFEGSVLSLLFQALAIVIILYLLRNRVAASNLD
jgi:membrane protease YdiL (CAAX protease family)